VAAAEVVEVWFDPQQVTFTRLTERAKERACADAVHTTTDAQQAAARAIAGDRARRLTGEVRPDQESKYYLRQSPLRYVPMTELQAARVNAHVRAGSYAEFLSPRQQELLREVTAAPDAPWPVLVGEKIEDGWRAIARARAAAK
jgi:hypothetical protein